MSFYCLNLIFESLFSLPEFELFGCRWKYCLWIWHLLQFFTTGWIAICFNGVFDLADRLMDHAINYLWRFMHNAMCYKTFLCIIFVCARQAISICWFCCRFINRKGERMSGGGTQNSFRKALGALKDTTTVSLAKVNSDYKVLYKSCSQCISKACIYLMFLARCWIQELDIAIVKATNHVERPAKEKHIRGVFFDALLKIVVFFYNRMCLHMFSIWTLHFYLIMCLFYLVLHDNRNHWFIILK